jgi:hypothetical protein
LEDWKQGGQTTMMTRRTTFVLVVLALGLVLGVQGIKFDISPNTERCLKEELSRDVLVLGNYSVEQQQPSLRLHFTVCAPSIEILFNLQHIFSHVSQIMDPSKGEIFAKDADEAHFSFTTENGGEFLFCFNDITDQSTLWRPLSWAAASSTNLIACLFSTRPTGLRLLQEGSARAEDRCRCQGLLRGTRLSTYLLR